MNAEQYLSETARIANLNFAPTDMTGSMTVARLGLLVQQSTGLHPTNCGFPQFKDVLSELERRSVLRLGVNSKGALAFWLVGSPSLMQQQAGNPQYMAPPVPMSSFAQSRANEQHPPFQRLLNRVWIAFINLLPAGRRFLNRETGEIRLGQVQPPEPPEKWIEIQPISQEDDKNEAVVFLREEGRYDDTSLRGKLDSPKWFYEFPLALGAADSLLAVRWKRRRTRWIIDRVDAWRQQNGIEHRFIFYQGASSRPGPPPREEAGELRRIVLSVVATMPTEDLLSLRLPLSHVLMILRPELLTE
jgi:hypothetical protein